MKRSVHSPQSRIILEMEFFFLGYRMNLFRICHRNFHCHYKTDRILQQTSNIHAVKYVLEINEVDNYTVSSAVTVVQGCEKCSAAEGDLNFLRMTSFWLLERITLSSLSYIFVTGHDSCTFRYTFPVTIGIVRLPEKSF